MTVLSTYCGGTVAECMARVHRGLTAAHAQTLPSAMLCGGDRVAPLSCRVKTRQRTAKQIASRQAPNYDRSVTAASTSRGRRRVGRRGRWPVRSATSVWSATCQGKICTPPETLMTQLRPAFTKLACDGTMRGAGYSSIGFIAHQVRAFRGRSFPAGVPSPAARRRPPGPSRCAAGRSSNLRGRVRRTSR